MGRFFSGKWLVPAQRGFCCALAQVQMGSQKCLFRSRDKCGFPQQRHPRACVQQIRSAKPSSWHHPAGSLRLTAAHSILERASCLMKAHKKMSSTFSSHPRVCLIRARGIRQRCQAPGGHGTLNKRGRTADFGWDLRWILREKLLSCDPSSPRLVSPCEAVIAGFSVDPTPFQSSRSQSGHGLREKKKTAFFFFSPSFPSQ